MHLCNSGDWFSPFLKRVAGFLNHTLRYEVFCEGVFLDQPGKTPPSIRHYPPRLGEQGDEILREAGFSEDEIGALVAKGGMINPDL